MNETERERVAVGAAIPSNVNLDDRQAAERDVNEVITQNKPLSFDDFPANRPKNTDILHRSLVGSRTLKTRSDLQSVIAESVSAVHLSNFAEISLPRTSARRPTFPTFTRFSTARFAEMAASDLTVVALPASDPSNAKYALRFPVSLLVTDGKNMPITGLPPQGLGDSIGYPLFYDANTPLKSIPVRSSGAMYPANLSRALSTRMSSTYPDIQTTKTWAHMFQLSNDRDAQTILLQRVLGAATGDNHIALLLKAYLLYFDSVAACLEGVTASRVPLTSTNVVVNIASQNGWPAQLLNSGREMVNVLGGSNEYQEFWAYCCFDKAPIFAAIIEDGGTSAVTMFSRYSLNSGGNGTTCLCDCDAYSSQREPDFFGKPSKILGHIESYVQRYALQQQANEALQIAMMWPTLYHTGAHISLPRPLHTVDWFGGEVEHTTIETSYRELAASDALVTLASTLAGALAVQSQVYDYVTLLSSERNTWALSPEAIRAAVAWLSAKISAPGAGWDFLLRHQFHVTPSFFYLTGLCSSSLDWEKLFSGLVLRESLFPAHLRLIQPFLVQSSVCCILPWQEMWKPDIELVGGRLCATPSTIMRLIRLGLIGEQPAHGYSPQLASEGIYPIISREGMETVEISASALDRLRVAREHGLRVFANNSVSSPAFVRDIASLRDPADITPIRGQWASIATRT